ncbi:hypothetical protein TNCT_312001 [Trichonephila clavata]|uniref:Uncharacterized protein n=1 Tax=Trichonephila clavata TaxID=2740835 RepID=A0A8X6GK06_TRICU|nr:hypothetical protein TNCT_312001 [Trichonephila clavata]
MISKDIPNGWIMMEMAHGHPSVNLLIGEYKNHTFYVKILKNGHQNDRLIAVKRSNQITLPSIFSRKTSISAFLAVALMPLFKVVIFSIISIKLFTGQSRFLTKR